VDVQTAKTADETVSDLRRETYRAQQREGGPVQRNFPQLLYKTSHQQ